MVTAQMKELLLQSLVHERGGVLVYQTALECAVNEDLRKEWEKYLSQTQNHVAVLMRVCDSLNIDPGEMTPGCVIVQHTGKSLIVAMKMALAEGDPVAVHRRNAIVRVQLEHGKVHHLYMKMQDVEARGTSFDLVQHG
jgi:hypothetical protein